MSTRAKIVDFRTEKRKANSKKEREIRLRLLSEEVAKDLAELDRLFAEDGAQLLKAIEIGGAE